MKTDLATQQSENEIHRATAAVNAASSGDAEGQRSVDDLIAEQVAKISADLEEEHKKKVQESEEKLERRTTQMRERLNARLREEKAKANEEMQAQLGRDLQVEKETHEAEIQKLKAEHQKESEIVKQEAERLGQQIKTGPPQDAAVSSEPSTAQTNGAQTDPLPGLSESTIKEALNANPVLKKIVGRNVHMRVEQMTNDLKTTITAQVEEEHKKQLADVQSKADAAKDQAVMMESKKQAAKINMAENRLKTANAKIDVVDKAAQETPQKPVVEVWEIAKTAKPSVAPPTKQPPASSAPASSPASTPAKPTPATAQPPATTNQSSSSAESPVQGPTTSTSILPPGTFGGPQTQQHGRASPFQQPGALSGSPTLGPTASPSSLPPGTFGGPQVQQPGRISPFQQHGPPQQNMFGRPSAPSPQQGQTAPDNIDNVIAAATGQLPVQHGQNGQHPGMPQGFGNMAGGRGMLTQNQHISGQPSGIPRPGGSRGHRGGRGGIPNQQIQQNLQGQAPAQQGQQFSFQGQARAQQYAGRGRGAQGRGGPGQQPPQQGQNMATALNPAANQFQPNTGSKRPRDDSEDGGAGGKRSRGGSGDAG